MTLIQAILLGIVQGLTEFIPISSTAHLVLASRVLGLALNPEQLTASIAVIQLGTLIAVFIYFARDIWKISSAFVRDHLKLLTGGRGEFRLSHDARLGWLVVIGSLPVAIVGLLFKKQIEGTFTKNLWVIATMMVVIALLLAVAEAVGKRQRQMQDLTIKDALIVGFAQCLALVPGVSRSGATISVGLMRGLDRVTATRLAFLLGIPALVGAGVYELPAALKDGGVGPLPTLVGTVVSFVVAYASIAWLLKYVAGHTIAIFVWYRWILAAAIIIALSTGVLAAT